MKCPTCGAPLAVTVLPTETAPTRARFTLEVTHPHQDPEPVCTGFADAIAGAVGTALAAS